MNKILIDKSTFTKDHLYYVNFNGVDFCGKFIKIETLWDYVPYTSFIFDSFSISNNRPGPIYINDFFEINSSTK